MLELRNVTKIYKTKSGETRALDGVSANFPEKGMIFVLGKSGSGKSTLLNVCGGLDVPDQGEVVVKGKSTESFSATDFDSYRNTCVGFVFQEYNILGEFNVEDNVAIALELQGKPKNAAVIADILRQVDLEDCAKRMPATLSGGQKQRVAIARALVKNPEIIMADEPSGALDSLTGKQVFDTLKKLSRDKLVLVVSHDKDFAERYADRIIELKDGKIISDVVKTVAERTDDALSNIFSAGDDTLILRKGAQLDEEDLRRIREFVSTADKDVLLCKKDNISMQPKKGSDVREANGKTAFVEADSMPEVKKYSPEESRFIKSKLPLRRAIKIGASGMKIKPFRFAITLLLSIVSFTMFGLFSTVMFYDEKAVAVNSLSDTREQYINAAKTMIVDMCDYQNGEYKETHHLSGKVNYTDDDITALKDKFGYGVIPVYDLGSSIDSDYRNGENSFSFHSFVPAEQVNAEYTTGRAPAAANEMAISEYAFNILKSEKDNGVSGITDLIFQKDGVSVSVCGVYKTPYSPENLSFDESMPFGYSTAGDNFYLSALVTQDFYDAHKRAFDNGYLPQLNSYVSGFSAKAGQGSYSSDTAKSVRYIGRSNAVKSMAFSDVTGIAGNLPEDGLTINYEMWRNIFAQDLASAVSDQGLGDLFSSVKDENGLSLLDKYVALNECEFYDAFGNLTGTPEHFLSDLMSFVNGHNIVKNYDLTIYNDNRKAILTAPVKAVCYPSTGYYEANTAVYANGEAYEALRTEAIGSSSYFQEFLTDFDFVQGIYSNVLIPVADDRASLSELIYGSYEVSENYTSYAIENANYAAVTSVGNTISMLSGIFLFTGLGLALFAALLLFNFISVSVADKKREIGILRAVGAKSSDVFKIFLSESMIIVLICALASTAVTAIVCAAINAKISATLGITFSLFSFGILSVVMIFGIAVITALVSTVVPVYAFARKKPVDTIRGL